MIHARRFLLAAALCATAVLTGCTQTSAGTALPDATENTSDTTNPTDSTTSTEPSSDRPQEIDLEGKDPCRQIPQADWPSLGIEHAGEPSEEPTFKSPNCYYSSVGDVTLVITDGVESWIEKAQNVDVDDADPIAGFPTITVWNEADQRSCYTAVDVADGQHLLTTATSVNANVDRAETCDRSHQLAESAMKTLVAS